MAMYHFHLPTSTRRGGLTTNELFLARMPCYFGSLDCNTSKSCSIILVVQKCVYNTFADPGILPDVCSLCWDLLGPASSYRLLPCGHIFHLPCIDNWICNEDARCPLCRQAFYYLRKSRLPNNGATQAAVDEHTHRTKAYLKAFGIRFIRKFFLMD